jgi:two-component system, OmpR family, alkaline phosphatase synthesis response regulator PhoP
MRNESILIVDDESPIVELISLYLTREGFSVMSATDGPAALDIARRNPPALVILDVMLPGMDGLDVCRKLQQAHDVYVLMLTARADEADKLVGLSVGADDYLTKPFSPRELVARVRAILRRQREQPAPLSHVLKLGPLLIDVDGCEVRRNGVRVDLTPIEFQLLLAMAQQPGRVFSRDQLLERVWGSDFAGIDRVVDVHIGLLRKKVETDPANPDIITTIRGVGYKLVVRQPQAV